MMRMLGATHLDFMGKSVIAVVISCIIIVIGIVAFAAQGNKNFGIDFLGGALIELKFDQKVKVEEIRDSMKEIGLGSSTIQQTGEGNIIIKTGQEAEDAIQAQITKTFPKNSFEILKTEEVGPAIGRDLKKKALLAIILALIGIMTYLGFRFELSYGIGALLALFHDVLITMTFLALTGTEISISVVAALLTVVGYSVNDTIVVFDRVRENLRYMRKTDFKNVLNTSINQTLSRTILTSLTSLFVVASLFIFGGEVIHDFAFALLVGTISGTYSTMFIASPAVLWWRGNRKI